MHVLLLTLIYLMFFLSGAAALMYEVVWVRSLSLVFGGTHLAVTAVLSVFMGGLALGSYFIGRRVDDVEKPLRLYGYLEFGIALAAASFILLMKIYPSVYAYLAQGKDHSIFYLSFIRVVFTGLVLIVPTTLMGGTLPLLTRFVSGHHEKMGTHLSLLYGFNTLGAVAGTAAAGFFFLRFYSVSATLYTAIAINSVIGLVSILLHEKVSAVLARREAGVKHDGQAFPQKSPDYASEANASANLISYRLVLLGIGISGFCALGYEVLWTRILTLTIGTSVYGFTIMLVAFLTGIALGSETYGLFPKLFPDRAGEIRTHVIGFGIVQFLIGVAALFVTFHIRDLPLHSTALRGFFLSGGFSSFESRQWANISLAFAYMIVPAFFMGLAFPLAGKVQGAHRKKIGHAVGDVLTFNTVGAIFGSAVSGFVMIYLFGIERSLQILTVINIGFGLLVIVSLKNYRVLNWTVGGLTLAFGAFLVVNQDALRMWDTKFFAIFQNNQPESYDTPGKRRDAIENTDVLFYHEGVNSTISSIKPKGGIEAVLVNGKVVASASLKDQQCQLTLGHLPMLLHENPEKVLVVGLGTGMTLGATSIHPEVKELTLAEIEPEVVGAARTFGKYNNHVLDNPKLDIVFNDGRNFLMTTEKKFDVITADPIHPWTQGSGYLYTSEYFKLASEHLLPGGIMCQWLPIYELSVDDLKSVVKTFSRHFKYTMTWLTQYDAEIIGSNSPLVIDEAELQRKFDSETRVADDLKRVHMGSAADFLSYFIMGTDAMKAFSSGGVINTDDNLYLEFSAPKSVGLNVMRSNVNALAQYRENILPYLLPAQDGRKRQEQEKKWEVNMKAAVIADRAHALFLGGYYDKPEFLSLLAELDRNYPEFAPGRFLRKEHKDYIATIPVLLQMIPLALLNDRGETVVIEISAVKAGVSEERAAVIFVDNNSRVIFGQRYFSGPDIEKRVENFSKEVLADIQTAYQREQRVAAQQGKSLPPEDQTMRRIKDAIAVRVQGDS